MSKGLEALKRIKNALFNRYEGTQIIKDIDFAIIEKELKEIERLKTSYLENLLNEESKEYIYKKLKALEIIKEKKVDVNDLINEFAWSDGLTSYNERTNHIPLTQEEYDLLKEVLKDD